MKKIGIIGGVGPQATNELYRQIINFAQQKYDAKNNDDFPRIIIDSNPIPDFISSPKAITKAENMLQETVENLFRIGVDKIAIASNTVHLLYDKLSKGHEEKFISMIDAVVEKCEDLDKVGILGSPMTLRNNLYSSSLASKGIKSIKPSSYKYELLNSIIRNVLSDVPINGHTEKYIDVLNSLIDQGAEKIILACTELPLAINYEALGPKIINSIEILAEYLVDYYYSN